MILLFAVGTIVEPTPPDTMPQFAIFVESHDPEPPTQYKSAFGCIDETQPVELVIVLRVPAYQLFAGVTTLLFTFK